MKIKILFIIKKQFEDIAIIDKLKRLFFNNITVRR